MQEGPASSQQGDETHQQFWITGENGLVSQLTTERQDTTDNEDPDESTPLLSRTDSCRQDQLSDPRDGHEDTSTAKNQNKWRWSIVGVLLVLIVTVIFVTYLAFAAPSAVEEYAKKAAVFKPTDLSIEAFTHNGIKARIQGDFKLDSSRVPQKSIRALGRVGTWIAGAIETRPTTIEVSLPEYGDFPIGTAALPKIVVSIKDRRITHINLTTEIEPGNTEGLRHIATDWVEGRLGHLRVQAKTSIALKSGIFNFGTSKLTETLTFESSDIPSIPKYIIDKINVHEIELPDNTKAMSADVSISALNKYPVTFTVPPLAFDVLVTGCSNDQPFIKLANASTEKIDVRPQQVVHANAQGVVRQLSDKLLDHCPGSEKSPLDSLLGDYINGDKTTLFIKGADLPGKTPGWISDITKSVTLPVPLSGRSMDNLIRNFSMSDVRLGMPNPLADPDSRAAQPKVSATINVVVNLPKEMNLPISVSRIRSRPDVYYKHQKLGELELDKWRAAESHYLGAIEDGAPGLLIKTILKNTPIWITNEIVFSSVIQQMLIGNGVTLGVRAAVDIEVKTAIGKAVVRDIPAKGEVPIHPLPSNGRLDEYLPRIGDLQIVETSTSSISLEMKANFTNPTNYSATIPYANLNILCNGTILAQAYVERASICAGQNKNLRVRVYWNPEKFGGNAGIVQGQELLSQYLSDYNTSLVLQTHRATFPSNPAIGSALSRLKLKVQTPRIEYPSKPGDGDGDGSGTHRRGFIQEATMHLFTSTASFELLSPLKRTTLMVTYLNATALYKHSEPVGQITYDLPIAVRPGLSETPKLPVDWSLTSIGYNAIKEALGGSLKLDSRAIAGLAIENFRTRVWYEGKGIGAKIRL